MTDHSGQQLGNYRLIRLIGQGGFADTYLGEHLYLKTYAAIKVLQAQLGQNDQEAFYNEARTIARLRHPNIVRIMEFGVEPSTNTPYLVMDHAPNGTLRQRHRRGIALPVSVVLPYVKQIGSALQYAHDQKLVHRDVKPENMLVGADNEILLSDFGIAVVAHSTRAQDSQSVAGTVTYMAPEQIQGRPRAASDQYALGIVIYEWLCGVVPFSGTYVEVAIQHERVAPAPLREHASSISPDIEQVVLTALAKDPKNRFGSVQAFATALEQASTSTRPQSQPLPLSQPLPDTRGASSSPLSLLPDPELYKPTEMMSPTPVLHPTPAEGMYNRPQTAYGLPDPNSPQFTPPGMQNPPPVQQNTVIQPGVITPPPIPPSPSRLSLARRISSRMALLIVLVVLLLVGGSALIVYSTVVRPGQLHAQATATAIAQITGTANAQATGVARATATSQAQDNATATANAQATAVVTEQAQATATAWQNFYNQATSGTPTISDHLSAQDNFGWAVYAGSPSGGCAFTGGVYHSIAPSGYNTTCNASSTNFANLALQVQMTIVSGSSGGIIFRSNGQNNFYEFRITTDGAYLLEKVSASDPTHFNYNTLLSGNNSAITTGNNQSNLLTVIVRGTMFYLYVNKQYLDSTSDNSYGSGEIGVFAISYGSNSVDAAFKNLQVWKL